MNEPAGHVDDNNDGDLEKKHDGDMIKEDNDEDKKGRGYHRN